MQVKLTNEMFIRIVTAVMVVVDALVSIWEKTWRFIVLAAAMAAFASAIIEARVLFTGSQDSYYGTTDGLWGTAIIIVSAVACVYLFVELMNSKPSPIREVGPSSYADTHGIKELTH